jgi:hypothetical protein
VHRKGEKRAGEEAGMRRRGLLSPLLSGVALLHTAAATCAPVDGECVCTDADGDEWTLSDLEGPPTVTGAGTPYDWYYNWDFCVNVPLPAESGTLTPAAAATCAYRLQDFPTPSLALLHNMGPDLNAGGSLAVAKLDPDAETGVAITYTSGFYTLTVNLRCDETLASGTVGTPTAPAACVTPTAPVVIDWNTHFSCRSARGHPFNSAGLSFGWTFIILFSVSGVLYVGGGYGYDYQQKKGDPSAAPPVHPHTELWKKLPPLVSEGWFFTRLSLSERFEFLRFLDPVGNDDWKPSDGGGKKGYQQIDSNGKHGGSDKAGGSKPPIKSPARGGKKAPPPMSKPKPVARPQAEASESETDSESESDDSDTNEI